MPIELTIYQVAERLGITTGEAMKLYREDAFPNAVPNRQARDVRIPIEDVEAYERRIKGLDESPEGIEVTGLDAELTRLEKADKAEDLKIAIAAKRLKFKTPEEYAQALQDLEDRRVRQDERGARQDEVDAELEEKQSALNEDIADFEQRGGKVTELAKLLEEIAAQETQPEYNAYLVAQGMQAHYILPSQIKDHWHKINLLLCEIAGIAKPIDEEDSEDTPEL